MATIIEDGTGKGNSVKVDAENRLFSRSITETEFENAVRKGLAFNVNTKFLPITTAGPTDGHALLYIKNNEDRDIILAAWFIGTDLGTNGADLGLMQVFFNPTGGTIVSGGTAITPVNRQGGNSNTIDLDALSGGDSFTATGLGEPVLYQTQSVGSRAFGTVQLSLKKGASAVVTYIPNGAETAGVDIYTGFQLYISETED